MTQQAKTSMTNMMLACLSVMLAPVRNLSVKGASSAGPGPGGFDGIGGTLDPVDGPHLMMVVLQTVLVHRVQLVRTMVGNQGLSQSNRRGPSLKKETLNI